MQHFQSNIDIVSFWMLMYCHCFLQFILELDAKLNIYIIARMMATWVRQYIISNYSLLWYDLSQRPEDGNLLTKAIVNVQTSCTSRTWPSTMSCKSQGHFKLMESSWKSRTKLWSITLTSIQHELFPRLWIHFNVSICWTYLARFYAWNQKLISQNSLILLRSVVWISYMICKRDG